MADERKGLPSASIVERLALCPGSQNASRGLPEIVTPEMKAYADSGDRVHLWLQAPDLVDLAPWPEELDVAERCADERDNLIEKVFPTVVGAYVPTIEREFRIWLHVEKKDAKKGTLGKFRDIFSGKLDLAAWTPTTGLVIDYKSGRGDKTESPRNLQLRSQCVLLWVHTGRTLKSIFATIVQPLVGKPQLVEYTAEDLAKAEAELMDILAAAEDPKAKRVAGRKQCEHCPAKFKCPEAIDTLKILADEEVGKLIGIAPKDLVKLLDLCNTAAPIIRAVNAHAKAVLTENPELLKPWRMSEGTPQRTIINAQGVYEALLGAGMMDEGTFIKECVSVGIGDLEKSVAAKNKLKPKEAKNVVKKFIDPFVEVKIKAGSLERADEE